MSVTRIARIHTADPSRDLLRASATRRPVHRVVINTLYVWAKRGHFRRPSGLGPNAVWHGAWVM